MASKFLKVLMPLAAIVATPAIWAQVKPYAVVPTATPGHARPYIWNSGKVVPVAIPHGVQKPASALPGFCTGGFTGIYCPNNVQVTYGLSAIPSANGGAGRTIAIVDAYHYAGAEADLNTFASVFGLPACTVASGCLTIVNENGNASPLPVGTDTHWELEEMLDLEYAHTMAPNAKLVMVECDSNGGGDLYTGVQTATGLADIVSDSWGSGEFGAETSFDYVWATNNKMVFFSSGDSGAPAQYPCASPNVVCVGGTTLTTNVNYARVSETGWSGSGGGCSEFESLPFWQNSGSPVVAAALACGSRAVPDIAALADPNTGVAVVDVGNCGVGNACLVGGTSLACPLMAGLFADIQTSRATFGQTPLDNNVNSVIYAAAIRNYAYFFYDVTSGNNGLPAGADFDLVTGLGVAKGSAMANRFFGLIYQGLLL